MGFEEIPKTYQYTCDACIVTHKQEHGSEHYHNATPPGWTIIRVYTCTENFNPNNTSFEKLLCEACAGQIIKTIKEWRGRLNR